MMKTWEDIFLNAQLKSDLGKTWRVCSFLTIKAQIKHDFQRSQQEAVCDTTAPREKESALTGVFFKQGFYFMFEKFIYMFEK